jgi:adhesin transport system outer membrane protein
MLKNFIFTLPMPTLFRGALVACLAGMAGQAFAQQDAGRLDVGAAAAKAVSWHPSVRQAIDALRESSEYIGAARAGYHPQVRGGIASDYRHNVSESQDQRQVNRLVLSVSQMLYDFGKVSSSVDRAEAEQMAARARVLQAIDKVTLDATRAVIEVQRYQALQRVADEQVAGVSAIANLTRQRRREGANTLSDEVQAQAREQAAKATQLQISAEAESWRTYLRNLTGLTQFTSVDTTLPDSIAQGCRAGEPDWQRVPAVLVAEAEKARVRADLDQAGAQMLPTLSLEGSVSRALEGDPYLGERNDAIVTLNLNMPLYQGGALQAEKRAAHHALNASAEAGNHARFNATQGLEEARNRSLGFEGRRILLAARETSIERTRELYKQQYLELGTRSLLDLLNAEQELYQARLENIHNRHELYRMQMDCLYNRGELRAALALDGTIIAGIVVQP